MQINRGYLSSSQLYRDTNIQIFNMNTLGILLALSPLALSFEWDGLRVTWKSQQQDPERTSSLFKIPRTQDEAVSAGWVEVKDEDSPKVTVYCIKDDYRFCVLLDGYGHVAGFQAGVSVHDLAPMQNIYDLSKIDTYKKKIIFGEEIWTTTIYTVDPDIIEAGGRTEMNGLTGTDGIWIERKDGYFTVPKNVADLDPIWLEQTCINEMGTHYYYNMSRSFPCEKSQPWFLLYQDGKLNGCGLEGFGNASIESREWYEALLAPITYVIPEAPQCLSDWIADDGLIFMHVFLVEEPWKFSCEL